MKIAVTAQGRDVSSGVDARFGRGPWFIIVDTETGQAEAVDNEQNLQAAQGAGIQAAQTVARHGAAVLLTGHCGPNAFRTLAAAGVQVFTNVTGTVAEAVERFKKGELTAAGAADVDGHWA